MVGTNQIGEYGSVYDCEDEMKMSRSSDEMDMMGLGWNEGYIHE